LEEHVDAKSDSRALEVGCIRVSVSRPKAKRMFHVLPLNMSMNCPFLTVAPSDCCMDLSSSIMSSSV
jgi:hypothetical protein